MDETLKKDTVVRVTGYHCTPGFKGKLGIMAQDSNEMIASVLFPGIKKPVMFLKSDLTVVLPDKTPGS
jgi:hypothetical protein